MALNDDYLKCKSYEGHQADPQNKEFTIFQDEKSGKFFFAYFGNTDKVLLRSEGYESVAARDKGIASVIKNSTQKKRYTVEEENGQFFIILKAGNHKEIGRSCDYKTKAEAEAQIELYSAPVKKETVKKVAAVKAESKKTVVKTAQAEAKTEVKAKTVTKTVKVAEATNPAKVKAEKKEDVIVESKTKTKAEKTAPVQVVNPFTHDGILSNLEDFLEVDFYLNRPRIWDSYGITGYVKFQEDNGRHYFGVYNPDATLYLRSKGYATELDRDNAFYLMDSIILLEENYKIENLGGKYYAVLFDQNEIVAISPAFSSFIDAFVTTPAGRPKEVVGTMF